MTWEPTRLEQARLEKLRQLREAGIDPYPLRVERTHTTAEASGPVYPHGLRRALIL